MAFKTGLAALDGPLLVAAITSVCSSGFLLFGYDQGVMSGVVISEFWLRAMGNPSSLMVGTITALYDVGAVVGAIAAAFSAEPLGRKYTLVLGTVILIVGTVLMGSAYERVQFMVARVITGMGIGYITSVTPVYQSEISQAAQRGWQFMQQSTGINVVTYYSPALFKESLGFGNEEALFMGCFLQVWYLLASFVTWYTIDRIGRRPVLITIAYGLCILLVLEAICVAIGGSAAGIAAVFWIFAFEACFTWGWVACVWIYPPEILPLKIRAKGAALAAAADFLGNFFVVEVTPVSLRNIGWRSYVIWAVLNLVNATIIWLFYPETAGIPLEHIDMLFAKTIEAIEDEPPPLHRRLQWYVVGKASEEVKRQRRLRRKGIVESEDGGVDGVMNDGFVARTPSKKSRSSTEHNSD